MSNDFIDDDATIRGAGRGTQAVLADFKALKARLVCLDDSMLDPSQKGLVIELTGETEVTIGRGDENTHPLKYQNISRKHARIFNQSGTWGVEDLNSANGVWLNDVRISQARLSPGDYLKLGAVPFRFVLDRPSGVKAASGSGEFEGERTLLFNDVRAANALMASEAAQRERSASGTPPAVSRAAQPATDTPAVASGSRTRTRLWLAGAALLVVLAGALLHWHLNPSPEELLEPFHKEIKRIVASVEGASTRGPALKGELQAGLSRVEAASTELEQQTNDKLRAHPLVRQVQLELLMLRLERQIILRLAEERPDQVARMVEQAATEFERLSAGVAHNRTLDSLGAVLALNHELARLQGFRHRFPSPSARAPARPEAADLLAYQTARRSFAELLRRSEVHFQLQTLFPLLDRLTQEMDQHLLPVLDQWGDLLKGRTTTPPP